MISQIIYSVVEPPIWEKNMFVKLDHLPRYRGHKKQIFETTTWYMSG